MSADLGAVQAGFNDNFAYGTLALANNTRVQLIDVANNAAGGGAEAVYVMKLVVPSGTTLDLNGLNLYVRDKTVAGTIVGGSITDVTGTVVANRQLFYNGANFDAPNIPLPNANDNAVATDKVAYAPGQGPMTMAGFTASGPRITSPQSLVHVSSYSRGINGIIVDLTGSHPGITVSDFVFKVGNNNSPSLWATAPAPTSVTVRALAGTGSDRVEIIWPDNSIRNTWLEVRVKANANTGLDDAAQAPNGDGIGHIFYFGNKVGESGSNNSASFITSGTDEIGARNFPSSNQRITNRFDYNRDGLVSGTDQILARNFSGSISFLNIPASPPAPPAQALALEGDSGIASALANNSSNGNSNSAGGVPARILKRLDQVDLNEGPVAQLFTHLAEKNTPRAQKVLLAADAVADELGLDHELLEEILTDLGLQ